jgi:nucleotide-binding universal stress UspA family protein
MNQPESAPAARRKFLVVVDDTPECKVALRFAARRAQATGGGVTLLYVMEPAEFQHWMFVGDLMEQESREEAERLLQGLAAEVNDLTSIVPELLVREGRRRDELLALIEEDPEVRVLVLGAAPGPEGPGPLVSALAGELSGSFSIPITVVPGTLTDAQVDELT